MVKTVTNQWGTFQKEFSQEFNGKTAHKFDLK
jgi:hypothetical protein